MPERLSLSSFIDLALECLLVFLHCPHRRRLPVSFHEFLSSVHEQIAGVGQPVWSRILHLLPRSLESHKHLRATRNIS